MTLPDLLQTLDAQGIKLSLRLLVDAPRGIVTDELRAVLVAHKPQLLARLGRDAQWEALAAQLWGPALDEHETPDDGRDPYADAERQAIQTETLIDPTPD